MRIGVLIELPLLAIAASNCFGACQSTAHAMPMATLPLLLQLPGSLVAVVLVLAIGDMLRGSALLASPRLTEGLGVSVMFGVTAAIQVLCIAAVYVALERDSA